MTMKLSAAMDKLSKGKAIRRGNSRYVTVDGIIRVIVGTPREDEHGNIQVGFRPAEEGEPWFPRPDELTADDYDEVE
jgi:hypothetical protein